ncbi:MAG: alpha/beta hydrolase [Anaerolineae bacterium]|nr:alpha/beta hydrolase [Anaerolineae bacterium]
MSEITGTFQAPDGTMLFTRQWPVDGARAVILLVHGVAEHSGRYAHVAAHLNAQGYAVCAFDLRGHGRSPGPRACVEHYSLYLDDLLGYFHQVRAANPGLPVFILGHSMGGLLALAFTARHQSLLAGMITSGAPVVLGEVTPRWLQTAAGMLARIAPRLPVVRLSTSDISRDPAVRAAYDSDPLNYRGWLGARQGVELIALADDARAGLPKIAIPALCLHGGADTIAPPASLTIIARELGAADKTIRRYEGMYHEIFNEPGKEEVLADVSAWLIAH